MTVLRRGTLSPAYARSRSLKFLMLQSSLAIVLGLIVAVSLSACSGVGSSGILGEFKFTPKPDSTGFIASFEVSGPRKNSEVQEVVP